MCHGNKLRSHKRTVLLAIGFPYSPEPYSSPKRLIPQYQGLEEYMKEMVKEKKLLTVMFIVLMQAKTKMKMIQIFNVGIL